MYKNVQACLDIDGQISEILDKQNHLLVHLL